MTAFREHRTVRQLTGRLGFGSDLLDELTAICRREEIRCGWVTAIGAVRKARVAFYDQARREYGHREFSQPLEIAVLTGNVSIKDGAPFIHAHVTLANEAGATVGGHLAQGTVVFACEFRLEIFDGPELKRTPDPETGLGLWNI